MAYQALPQNGGSVWFPAGSYRIKKSARPILKEYLFDSDASETEEEAVAVEQLRRSGGIEKGSAEDTLLLYEVPSSLPCGPPIPSYIARKIPLPTQPPPPGLRTLSLGRPSDGDGGGEPSAAGLSAAGEADMEGIVGRRTGRMEASGQHGYPFCPAPPHTRKKSKKRSRRGNQRRDDDDNDDDDDNNNADESLSDNDEENDYHLLSGCAIDADLVEMAKHAEEMRRDNIEVPRDKAKHVPIRILWALPGFPRAGLIFPLLFVLIDLSISIPAVVSMVRTDGDTAIVSVFFFFFFGVCFPNFCSLYLLFKNRSWHSSVALQAILWPTVIVSTMIPFTTSLLLLHPPLMGLLALYILGHRRGIRHSRCHFVLHRRIRDVERRCSASETAQEEKFAEEEEDLWEGSADDRAYQSASHGRRRWVDSKNIGGSTGNSSSSSISSNRVPRGEAPRLRHHQ